MRSGALPPSPFPHNTSITATVTPTGTGTLSVMASLNPSGSNHLHMPFDYPPSSPESDTLPIEPEDGLVLALNHLHMPFAFTPSSPESDVLPIEPEDELVLAEALDPSDNQYIPLEVQNFHLDLDDAAVPHILAKVPPQSDFISSLVSSLRVGADNNRLEVQVDGDDDNSSDSLILLDDHEFPYYFSMRGSPLRLFHSHGAYSLPVDSDEMKVRVTSLRSLA